jgi:hypothetical protein
MHEKTKPRRRKTTITLSLDDEIIEFLGKESKEKGFSVNANANNILLRYIYFYRDQEQGFLITIPKKVFQFYIDHINDIEHGAFIESFLFEFFRVYFHERKIPITLMNVIKAYFENIALNSGAIDSINYYVDSEGYFIIVIKHSYNIRWSNSACYAFKNLFERLLHLHIEYEALSNSFILKVLEKNISL